jgi:hypothetical protein
LRDVLGLAVRFRKYRNGSDVQFAARAFDPDRYLAAVGD